MNLGGGATVGGDIGCGGGLHSNGDATVGGQIQSGSLDVGGDATVGGQIQGGSLNVGGQIQGGTLNVSGGATVGGQIEIGPNRLVPILLAKEWRIVAGALFEDGTKISSIGVFESRIKPQPNNGVVYEIRLEDFDPFHCIVVCSQSYSGIDHRKDNVLTFTKYESGVLFHLESIYSHSGNERAKLDFLIIY